MLNSFQIAVLLALPGIGKKSVEKIIQHIDYNVTTYNELYDSIELIRKRDIITREIFAEIFEKNEKLFENFDNNQIRVISRFDNDFPQNLKVIDNPPIMLYTKGNLKCLSERATVAVVGTRDPSQYGFQMGRRVGELLAENNITVISGLAIGCDTAAHKGCLKANGWTVAVLAHGLHTIYPAANKMLAQEIIEMDGCLVTEYAFGQNPFKSFFVERDRLQSGLCFATIVIETDIKGGTMHTADFTQIQNRILIAVKHPNEKKNLKSKGNEHLIHTNKAKPLANQSDFDALIADVKILFNEVSAELKIPKNIPKPHKFFPDAVNVLRLDFDGLARRFKIKKIATIQKHIDDGSFTDWCVKKDPKKLVWKFDIDSNQFIAKISEDLFSQ